MTKANKTNCFWWRELLANLEKISLSLIICLSFTFHLFRGRVYATLFSILTLIYIVSKPIVNGKQRHIVSLWFGALLVIGFSFLRSHKTLGALMDVIILTCCVLLILFCSRREETYRQCIKVIIFFSFFYASGVFIQRFFPSLYSMYMRIFPENLANKVGNISTGSYTRGFSTNSGFTAGYICAGILALISSFNQLEKGKSLINNKRILNIILTMILLIALFYTGKRGHTLFLFLSITLCVLLSTKGLERVRWLCGIFLVIIIFVVIFFLLRDYLIKVPLIARIIDTINGLITGEDVSSSRLNLYKWAWQLFTENPLLGIGWGDYRTTVVGNATKVKELDTHNIYLQLLCETGSLGFLLIVMTFLVFWITTKKAYCKCLEEPSKNNIAWKQMLFFSFVYQTFFLLYGLTGNVLYEQHYQIL